MTILFSIFAFVLGAVFGSFLNVCIYRLPRSLSIVKPGSYCPNCRKPIVWFDNIPFFGYLFLRGRCRYCHKKISPRYVLVELLTASLFLALYRYFGLSASFFIFGLFIFVLILVTFIDWEHYLIPVLVVYPGIVLGLLFNFFFPQMAFSASRLFALKEAVIGVLLGAGLIYFLGVFGKLIFKKEAMGEGDIYLLAMIGAFLGWKAVLLTIFFSSLVGTVITLLLVYVGLKKMTDHIPFGPYLSLGAVIALFCRGSAFVINYFDQIKYIFNQ
ncbi:MAG: prepilin peptidase [Candidatus Ratteibacteria bacterium]|jgi:leader peptidase (prepilin peptidase)/N-methyltransferase